MKTDSFLALSQWPAFWQVRRAFLGLLFRGRGAFLYSRHALQNEERDLSSLAHVVRIAWREALLAVVVALALLWLDGQLMDIHPKPFMALLEDATYITLFATVSSISGIFIGLYYTAISVVGGSIYARVPGSLRALLARERLGSAYMRYLAFLTFLGLCFIGLRVLGLPPIGLAIPLITLMAGVGVIGFIKLGQRAFYLFDPTQLSSAVFGDLRDTVHSVVAGSRLAHDASFQHYSHQRARRAILTLEAITTVAESETHLSDEPLRELVKRVLAFLSRYRTLRRRIPSTSRWYEEVVRHPDWYRTEDSVLSIASETGTMLHPERVPNWTWVEARLFGIVLKAVKTNLQMSRPQWVRELYPFLLQYMQALAADGGTAEAFSAAKELRGVVVEAMEADVESSDLEGRGGEYIALLEMLALLTIQICLAYREKIARLSVSELENGLRSVRWRRQWDLYRLGLPTYCLPELEALASRIAFEMAAYRRALTPAWYLRDLLLRQHTESVANNADILFRRAFTYYEEFRGAEKRAGRIWAAAVVLSREWEYLTKASNFLPLMSERSSEMRRARHLESLRWTELDVNELENGLARRRRDLSREMSRLAAQLATVPRPEHLPDYGGQFLHTTGDLVFEALRAGDDKALGELFWAYLCGCFAKFASLRPEERPIDFWSEQAVKIAVAPLLDLMELSGLGRLFSDYHGNERLWEIVVESWERLLSNSEVKSPVGLLAAAINVTEAELELPHRASVRGRWAVAIRRLLGALPRVHYRRKGTLVPAEFIDHGSALVRVFGRSPFGVGYDGIDIWIAFYLGERVSGEHFGRRRQQRDLLSALERDEASFQEFAKGESEDGLT